jgi:predicted hydrocarbon binding protein
MLSGLLQKLLFINQFNMVNGKIDILGDRYIMFNSSSILFLQELDSTKMYHVMKDASKGNTKSMIEHAKVYTGIKDESLKHIAGLSGKMGSEEGMIKALQSLFEIFGLGKMNITDLDNKNKAAAIQVTDSTIALQELKKGKKKEVKCTITAGVIAGIFSHIFKKDVDCVEKKCLAKGDDICVFMVQ